MTAGITVYNDDGIIQIDETYRNLVLIQKFTYASTGDHTITLSGRTAPVAVLYSTDPGGIAFVESTNSSGSWTWRVNGAGEVYIFDVPPPPTAHGYGFQVFDAQGKIAFDSNYEVLRPLGIYCLRTHFDGIDWPTQTLSNISNGYGAMADYNTVEPSLAGDGTYGTPFVKGSGKWGWIQSGSPFSWYRDTGYGDRNGDNAVHKFLTHFYASGNNFKAKLHELGTVGSGEYWPGSSDGGIMVLVWVDLTGL